MWFLDYNVKMRSSSLVSKHIRNTRNYKYFILMKTWTRRGKKDVSLCSRTGSMRSLCPWVTASWLLLIVKIINNRVRIRSKGLGSEWRYCVTGHWLEERICIEPQIVIHSLLMETSRGGRPMLLTNNQILDFFSFFKK